MADATVSFDEAAAQRASAEARPLGEQRQYDRSTIEFPYVDLDNAVEVAQAIYARAGRSTCDLDELAAQMDQTLSGSFRMKTAAARLYGFTEKQGRDKIVLTPLGHKVVNPETEGEARAAAFLTVPLYREIFEKYRGHLLPPTKALEREMVTAGVAPKQADKARQTFDRSARQAGFYTHGEDRLVQPRFDRTPETRPVSSSDEGQDTPSRNVEGSGGGSGGDGGSGSPGTPTKLVSEVLLAAFDPNGMDEKQQEAVWTLLKYFKGKGL